MTSKTMGMCDRLVQYCRKELLPLGILILVLFSIRSSLADWNDVPTGSMNPTIAVGDRVFVNKIAYDLKVPFTTLHLAQWGNPTRGDIVVFYSPYDGKRLVKRVVGVPGDRIELRNNQLILNGAAVEYEPIPAEAVEKLAPAETGAVLVSEWLPGRTHPVAALPARAARRSFAPFEVPEGHYFVMGDNRDNSFDSRYWGAVARQQILGRASTVVFSLDHGNYWLPRWGRTLLALN